jgi:transcriptional regulator with XRE-family HTH domain
MKDIKKLFAKRVKYFRSMKGWSQEDLGYRAKLHRTYIGMIERAEKNITIENAQKLADAFHILVKELFNFK